MFLSLWVMALSAHGSGLADGLYSGVGGAFGKRRGTEVLVHGSAGGSDRAYLRRSLVPKDPVLISTANDNSTYWYIAGIWHYGGLPYLLVDGVAHAGTLGGRGPRTEVWVAIPESAAARLDAPRRQRAEIGQGLTGRFVSAGPHEVGGPMPIELRLAHVGEPVAMMFGGRQRGPRDNRFAFEVLLDGAPLPVIDGPDFGGPSTWHVLEDGSAHTVSADLASWVPITQPGTYEVRCRYEAELMRPTEDPNAREYLHERWDKPLRQTLTLEVR